MMRRPVFIAVAWGTLCVWACAAWTVPDSTGTGSGQAIPIEIASVLSAQNSFPAETGDVTIRRTDPVSTPLVLPAGQVLPDLVGIRLIGWTPDDATASVYEGDTAQPGDFPDFVRIDLIFDGLVNPPGTIGISGLAFTPYQYGPSPVFGTLSLDNHVIVSTGGHIGGAAEIRYLANVGRFGNMPGPPVTNRAVRSGAQLDLDFYTSPFHERSGADWELHFCGCKALTKVAEPSGDGDMEFEAGEEWIMNGRVFQRTAGYELGSVATGGSSFGLYDPLVDFRFYHYDEAATVNDRTIVTVVYPITMEGAAAMAEGPVQAANTDVSDHASIEESLIDIINGADSGELFGENEILQEGWAGQTPDPYLDPPSWRFTALFGTSYPDSRPYFYIWTDVAQQTFGDMDGDSDTDLADRCKIATRIDEVDGTARDADGVADGSVEIPDFGVNFYVEDIDADGLIDDTDVYHPMYDPPPNPGDVNDDGVVDFTDLNIILGNWGRTDDFVFRPDGDLDGDGAVTFSDLNQVLAHWGTVYPQPFECPALSDTPGSSPDHS